jgi:hypothetical protein
VVRASGLSRRARPAAVMFGAPRTLAASGLVPNSQGPVAAIDAREGSHGINGRLYVRRGRSDGRFAAAQRLGSDQMTSGSQSVSVAPDGTEVVAWQDEASHGSRSVIEVAIARPGRPFGHPQVVASIVGAPSLIGGALTFPRVVALDGRIAVVWGEQHAARDFFARRPKPFLAAAVAGPGGRFAPGRMLADTDGDDVVSLAAAADPRGDIVAVYARAIGDFASTKFRTRLDYVVSRAGSGTFERARLVSDRMIGPGTSLEWPGQLSAGPGGIEVPYAIRSASSLTMRAARLGARAAFAPARTIATPSDRGNGPPASGAVVALPGRGAPLAAWTTVDWADPGTFQLRAGSVNVARQRPSGPFGSPIAHER